MSLQIVKNPFNLIQLFRSPSDSHSAMYLLMLMMMIFAYSPSLSTSAFALMYIYVESYSAGISEEYLGTERARGRMGEITINEMEFFC